MRTLALLLLAALLAGCADNTPAAPEGTPAPSDPPEVVPAEPSEPEPAPAPDGTPCEDYQNQGSMVSANDQYVVTDGGGGVRVYQESNGRAGLQDEASCPGDPDTRQA